jgi:hypothetical protein
MKEPLRNLTKLRIQEINDQSLIAPLTKEQRMMFETVNIDMTE